MAMVSADDSRRSADSQPKSVGLVWGLAVGSHPALSLHSSNKPGELSQWLCHDDSTINIATNIIIIIIISNKLGNFKCILNPTLLTPTLANEPYKLQFYRQKTLAIPEINKRMRVLG